MALARVRQARQPDRSNAVGRMAEEHLEPVRSGPAAQHKSDIGAGQALAGR